MNVIGEIGQLIIKYQVEVEIILTTIAALILMIFIIKALLNGRKKRELLAQISRTVMEINSTVNNMGEKKTEVIYIDTRMHQKETSETSVELPGTEIPQKPEVVEEKPLEPVEPITEPLMEELHNPKKYYSRDCAVDKTGKIYTIEELENQIKE